MKTPKVDNSGVEAANAAIAQAQAQANNLQKNFAADLNTQNVAAVQAGGTAEAAEMVAGTSPKKRRQGTGLSSQLGISA